MNGKKPSRNEASGSVLNLAASWTVDLAAEDKSPRTIECYLEAVTQFAAFLAAQGMPTQVADIQRTHVAAFQASVLARWTASTAANRYRALRRFFGWLVEIEEIDASPMAAMKPPAVVEKEIEVLRDADLTRLLRSCGGHGFTEVRDTAMFRVLIDTGMRRSELAGLTVDDVDWDYQVLHVLGKGRRPRPCPFNPKTAKALDRYLRVRAKHPFSPSPHLWLGRRGPLTTDGVKQMVERRGEGVGLHLHAHRFRHTFAHDWMAQGGPEGDLMRLVGWKSRQMLDRYGASAAQERAQEAHRRLGRGDRV